LTIEEEAKLLMSNPNSKKDKIHKNILLSREGRGNSERN
jgi:hypothetical protein